MGQELARGIIREKARRKTYRAYIETRPPAIVANIIISLILQTTYLLDQQLRQSEKASLQIGGLRET